MSRFGGPGGMLRVEDRRLLTGNGRFADNLSRPGQCWMVVVRSPHAHAELGAIDASVAQTAPGVIAVLLARDLHADGVGHLLFPPMFKQPDGSAMAAPPRSLLASERVRFVGEPVAAILAETRAQAQDAADLVAIEYRALPHVVDVRAAIAADAPQIWPQAKNNIAARHRLGDAAATTAAFARAAHVCTIELVNNRLIVNAMEPRASLAEYDGASGRYTLHTCTQNPTAVRQMLAEAVLKVPLRQVRVIVGDIGGGFGMKSHLYPEDALAAYAAGKFKRAVRWRADRSEEFLAATQGRDYFSHAELAFDAAGKILGMRVRSLANMGAQLAPASAAIALMLGPKVITGVYDIPAVDIEVTAVLTNTATVAPYRGAGRPEAIYLIERLIEKAAGELGLASSELRRRNLIGKAAMPYTNAVGETYDSGDFSHFMDQALARADVAGFGMRRGEAAKRGKLRGLGLSVYVEWTGASQFVEKVDFHVSGNGHVTVYSATQAMGQGLETSYVALVAERLGLDAAKITVVQGDTDVVQGFGSMASRSAFVGGSAVAVGAQTVIDQGKALAAEALEAALADIVFKDGRYSIAGTDRAIDLFALAARQQRGLWVVETSNQVAGGTWPNGCHVCEVEIDPDTGSTEIVRYVTHDDVGRAVNPRIVYGQLQGGIAQGVGQALFEQAVYDRGSGQLLTGSLMDYALPHAADLPNFETLIEETVPCTTNPLGIKGCGESGTVGATPAVMNAILDALGPRGVKQLDMPATPYAIWRALRQAGA